MNKLPDSSCSIQRSLGVLGERWTLLVLRDAFLGTTKFAEFRRGLGIAPDVLSDRLATLVEYGALKQVAYKDAGARTRHEYRLTPVGHELQVVLGALQQWGDKHLPHEQGASMHRRERQTGEPLHVGFIDRRGRQVALAEVQMVPARIAQ